MQEEPKRFPILVLIIALLAGFFLGKSIQTAKQKPPASSSSALPNALFKAQTATFQGKITKINKDSLDVRADSGAAGNFKLSNKVYIYKFKAGASQATSSTDLKSIETGKRTLIILELSEGQYKAVSISYPPALKASVKN